MAKSQSVTKSALSMGMFPDFDGWAAVEWDRYGSDIVDLCREETAGLECLSPEERQSGQPLLEILEAEWQRFRADLWTVWISQANEELPEWDDRDVQIGDLQRRLRESEAANADLHQRNQLLEAGKASGEVAFCPVCKRSQLYCPCGYQMR
jgi:hypothetical protein